METSDKDSGLGGNQSYNLQETECPGSSCKWHSILVLLHWIFFFFLNFGLLHVNKGFLGGSAGKESPAMRETWVRSLVWEDPLDKVEWLHTPVFWPGEFHGLYVVDGVTKSQTRLRDFHYYSM